MILLNLNFTPYVPSTVIGLVGLLFACLYYYFRDKNNKELEKIKSVEPSDRLRAIEAHLNEIGTHIDTSNLEPSQKFELLRKILYAKTIKYIIGAIAAIIIAIIIALLIDRNPDLNTVDKDHPPNLVDTSKARFKPMLPSISEIKEKNKRHKGPHNSTSTENEGDEWIKANIYVAEKSLPWMSSSKGYSSTNKDKLLLYLNTLNTFKLNGLNPKITNLIKTVTNTENNTRDPFYNFDMTDQIRKDIDNIEDQIKVKSLRIQPLNDKKKVEIQKLIDDAKERKGSYNILTKEMEAYALVPAKFRIINLENTNNTDTKIQMLDALFSSLKIRKL